MKRFFFAVALLAAMPVFAEHVDPETARKVATAFLTNNGAKTEQLTNLSTVAAFPNLYIFTAEEGFVVLSADDCAKPVLGYSLTDNFAMEDLPENMKWWLQQYNDEIQWGINSGMRADENTVLQWQELMEQRTRDEAPTVLVPPLLSTNWDQGSPYNLHCPSGTVTGCVATAMAQVMKYWNYPETGAGSYSYEHPTYGEQSADFGATTYRWDLMIDNYKTTASTAEQKEAVATLMYHCGVSVDMNYGPTSGASGSKVPPALVTYFRYAPSATFKSKDSYTDEGWIAFIKTELDESRPVFYVGSNVDNEGQSEGHAFVCDGYRSDDYFHFNWGWSGYKDNYFAIGALNPNPSSGNAIGSGSGTYNLGNGIAAWVEPLSDLAAPVLSASLNNGSITLSWDASKDAVTYDLYRDNVKIGTGITRTNYTDTDVVSGTYYEYYVRAVSGKARSNPSNRVTQQAFFRDFTPSDLALSLTDSDVAFRWNGPANNSATLQYATGYSGTRYGMGEGKDTYWMEVFAPSRLSNYLGMYIEKVSAYLRFPGEYKLYIFQDEPGESLLLDESNKLIEQSFSVSGQDWVDIELSTPQPLDVNKNLCVVMYYPYAEGSPESNWYPATSGIYEEIPFDDEENPEFEHPRLIGEDLSTWYYIGANISWLFRTYLTDGTHTYNLYDNAIQVNDAPISETSYSISSPISDGLHQYTVKTILPNEESEASNTASLAVGSASTALLDLGTVDRMTVAPNSTLTVTGTLKSLVANHLILEDSAQLIHHSEEVMATVRKRIEPYTANDNGWYFITNPTLGAITPSVDNGLLSGNYDLYYYDEPTSYWRNHKANGFDLTPQQGYLYANDTLTTLEFAGTIHPSDQAITLDGLSHSATQLNGFNLVGNPFVCNATIGQDCYVISGNKVVLAATSVEIAPCEGVFVKASTISESVTFSPSVAKGSEPSNSFDLALTCNQGLVDRVRVRFGEGVNLEKFTLDGDPSRLCFRQNGQDYAVVHADTLNALPLYFEPESNGTYTLAVEAMGLPMEYLHLIDHLTGADIDLLVTPDYTFDANPSDFGARFQLVFHEIIAIDGFDFIEGQSQILDLTGRVVATDRNTRLAPGVYLIRTVDGNNVNIQKTIINN